MKQWLKLFNKSWDKINTAKSPSQGVRDFLLAIAVLALVGYGFWMLKLLEELIRILGNH